MSYCSRITLLFLPILLTFSSLGLSGSINAVIASKIQVIHSNDNPDICEFRTYGKKSLGTCSSFKHVKQDKVHMFIYGFEKDRMIFFAIPSNKTKGGDAEYKVKQLYYSNKAHNLKEDGICLVDDDCYTYASCLANGIIADYKLSF